MARESVVDSDDDEPFSPAAKLTNGHILDEGSSPSRHKSPTRTGPADYANEFGIALASPTRQRFRQTQSTTMDKLRNQASAYGQSTTLEDVARRKLQRKENSQSGTIDQTENAKSSTNEVPTVSPLSRDGDVAACSGISMSTPDFATVGTVSPPNLTIRSSSYNATAGLTQPLSEYENPLQVLVQPQASDELPSTKPSSDGPAGNTLENHPSASGTQDDLAAAAQIGDDLLANMLDPRYAETGMFPGLQQQDDSQDELAQGFSKPQHVTKSSKPSKKRTRIAAEGEIEDGKASKRRRHADPEPDDELFSGLPVEQYRPRKSRSRAAELDNDAFVDAFLSTHSVTKKRDSRHRTNRKNLSEAVVTHDIKQESDIAQEVEQQPLAPTKSRSKKNGKSVKDESLEDVRPTLDMNELSQHSTQSDGSKDAIVVLAMKELQEDGQSVNTKHKTSSKGKKRSKKATTKREALEDNHSPMDDEVIAVDTSKSLAISRSKTMQSTEDDNSLNTNQITIPAAKEEVSTEEHNRAIDEEQEFEQITSQAASQKERVTDHASEQVPEFKKAKGKGKKRAKSKKSEIEVVTLASSPSLIPVLKEEKQIEPDQTIALDNPAEHDLEPTNEGELSHHPQEAEAQVLSDRTNLASTDKPAAPEKPGTAPLHDPLKNTRVPYRVGLSRNSKIEPLLKIVRKEKDKPKDLPTKKKKA